MQNVTRTQLIMVSLVLILIAGCVADRYSYNEVIADLSVSGTRSVGVAVHDQRPYVKAGEKNPNFVGLQRGGFGNPLNVTTASRKPLATDMTGALVASLAKKGFRAVPSVVTPDDDQSAALQKLKETGAERLVLLTLMEWKSDTFTNTALHYNVSLKVYDRDGKVLVGKNIEGKDDLGGNIWDPHGQAREAVPRAFKEKIEALLNSPEVANALQ
jgi:hypothetical protein